MRALDLDPRSFNRRDFRSGELRFLGIIVQTPGAWLKSLAPLKE